MFVKLFTQILDSSIADNRKLRHLFTDLLLCADAKGYIMMTPSAIARRIGATVDEVEWGLAELQKPDPLSKTKTERGKRIEPMEGAGYGWKIINYESYRAVRDADQLREAARVRLQRHREKKKAANAGNVSCNAGNAMQKQTTEAEAEAEPLPTAPASAELLIPDDGKEKKSKAKGTIEEFRAFAVELGLLASDGDARFYALESTGWKVGNKPIKDWRMLMRQWQSSGYHPSQKMTPEQRSRAAAAQQPAQPSQPIDKRTDLEKHLDYWNAADALGKKPVDFGAWLRAGKPEN